MASDLCRKDVINEVLIGTFFGRLRIGALGRGMYDNCGIRRLCTPILESQH